MFKNFLCSKIFYVQKFFMFKNFLCLKIFYV